MKTRLLLAIALLSLLACSSNNIQLETNPVQNSLAANLENSLDDNYFESGTIILSRSFNKESIVKGNRLATAETSSTTPKLMSPLFGYFPPAASYFPADNEAWIEIDKNEGSLTLHKGGVPTNTFRTTGLINIKKGHYYLQHKETNPLWYATDDYFSNRELNIPEENDAVRFRKGVYGKYAMFPTLDFAIHNGPIWFQEVDGIRLSADEISVVYNAIELGASIVVR